MVHLHGPVLSEDHYAHHAVTITAASPLSACMTENFEDQQSLVFLHRAGDTALIIAARLGRIKTIAQLLAKGVDRTICNKFGEDAKSQSTAALSSIILTASVQAVLALSTGKVIPLKQARSLAILDMMKDGDDEDAFGDNDEAHSWDLEDPFHPDVTFRPMRKNQECPFTPQGTNKMTFLKSQSCDEESDSKKIG
jgi:hypothetical protein